MKRPEFGQDRELGFDEEKVCIVLMSMEHGLSLRQGCELVDLAPSTFLGWVEGDSSLAEHYARARERLLDVHAEELEDIGERAANASTSIEVSGLRLLSDNRKWLLSKLSPKKYGDKVAIGGSDDMPPIQTTTLTPTQRAARVASILAKAAKAKQEAERG